MSFSAGAQGEDPRGNLDKVVREQVSLVPLKMAHGRHPPLRVLDVDPKELMDRPYRPGVQSLIVDLPIRDDCVYFLCGPDGAHDLLLLRQKDRLFQDLKPADPGTELERIASTMVRGFAIPGKVIELRVESADEGFFKRLKASLSSLQGYGVWPQDIKLEYNADVEGIREALLSNDLTWMTRRMRRTDKEISEELPRRLVKVGADTEYWYAKSGVRYVTPSTLERLIESLKDKDRFIGNLNEITGRYRKPPGMGKDVDFLLVNQDGTINPATGFMHAELRSIIDDAGSRTAWRDGDGPEAEENRRAIAKRFRNLVDGFRAVTRQDFRRDRPDDPRWRKKMHNLLSGITGDEALQGWGPEFRRTGGNLLPMPGAVIDRSSGEPEFNPCADEKTRRLISEYASRAREAGKRLEHILVLTIPESVWNRRRMVDATRDYGESKREVFCVLYKLQGEDARRDFLRRVRCDAQLMLRSGWCSSREQAQLMQDKYVGYTLARNLCAERVINRRGGHVLMPEYGVSYMSETDPTWGPLSIGIFTREYLKPEVGEWRDDAQGAPVSEGGQPVHKGKKSKLGISLRPTYGLPDEHYRSWDNVHSLLRKKGTLFADELFLGRVVADDGDELAEFDADKMTKRLILSEMTSIFRKKDPLESSTGIFSSHLAGDMYRYASFGEGQNRDEGRVVKAFCQNFRKELERLKREAEGWGRFMDDEIEANPKLAPLKAILDAEDAVMRESLLSRANPGRLRKLFDGVRRRSSLSQFVRENLLRVEAPLRPYLAEHMKQLTDGTGSSGRVASAVDGVMAERLPYHYLSTDPFIMWDPRLHWRHRLRLVHEADVDKVMETLQADARKAYTGISYVCEDPRLSAQEKAALADHFVGMLGLNSRNIEGVVDLILKDGDFRTDPFGLKIAKLEALSVSTWVNRVGFNKREPRQSVTISDVNNHLRGLIRMYGNGRAKDLFKDTVSSDVGIPLSEDDSNRLFDIVNDPERFEVLAGKGYFSPPIKPII